MWLACSSLGVQFEKKKIHSLTALEDFDSVIIAAGAFVHSLPELAHLKITPVKGQILEMVWPNNQPSLPHPFASQAYLLQNPEGKTCIAGATYEKAFADVTPNKTVAANEILPKINAFLPLFNDSMIVGCRAGVRASGPGHRPLVVNQGNNRWVITGMGSKGLLYHALYARELVLAMQN